MNYQRILSYLYDYDRGVKRKNIGFVKIEIRGDQCRVNLHMKLPEYLPPEMLQVYFFFRRNDEILGVPFTEAKPAGSECGVRTTVPFSFFEACGIALDEFAGIYICQGKRRELVFVSAWDDAPVYVETFRELEQVGERKRDGSAEQILQSASIEGRPGERETTEPGELLAVERNTVERAESPAVEAKTAEPVELLTVERNTVERAELPAVEAKTAEPGELLTVERNTVERAELPAVEPKMTEPEEPRTGESAEQSFAVRDRSPWEELAKNFTKLRIKDGDAVMECLKIRPHHLALLPRRYWNDSNNSFLLHGYYTWGYLILARRVPGEKYFLGIPGKNRDRDRVMAAYYGYTKYLLPNQKNHGVGYWCREITL